MHVAIVPLTTCCLFKDKDSPSHADNCALYWIVTQRVVVINS